MNKDFQLRFNSPEVQSVLKDVYLPTIKQETFFNAGALSEAFGMKGLGSTVNDAGNGLIAYISKGTIGSVGALKDNLTLAKASTQSKGDRFTVMSKGFQANAAITVYESLRFQNSDALVDLFEDQFATLQEDLKRQWGRQLYGSSHGIITTVTKAPTAKVTMQGVDVVVVEVADIRKFKIGELISFEGIKTGDGGFKPENGDGIAQAADGKYHVQMAGTVDVWGDLKTENVPLASFKIEDLDLVAGTITVRDQEEFINRHGATKLSAAYPATGKNVYYSLSNEGEMNGLEDLISEANYFGLSKAGFKPEKAFTTVSASDLETVRPDYLKPVITKFGTGVTPGTLSTAGSFLTEDIFEEHIDAMELKSGKTPDFLVTSRRAKRALASFGLPTVEVQRPSTQSAANDVRTQGYGSVDIFGRAINVDRFAPHNRLYTLDLTSFGMVMLSDLQFDDFDGVIWKQMHDANGNKQLAYSAAMVAWKNLYSTAPLANGYIEQVGKQNILRKDWDADLQAIGFEAKEITGAF